MQLRIDKTSLEIGESVTLRFEPNSDDVEYVVIDRKKEMYDPQYVKYYYVYNGETKQLNTAAHTPENIGTYEYYACYCNHDWLSDSYCNTEDIKSQSIRVEVSAHSISSSEDLKKMANSSEPYQLTADIDLSGMEWKPIDGFSGILDGNGHTIKNMTIHATGSNVGLFSELSGTVQNLNLENISIQCQGRYENIGALCGGAMVGGIIGYARSDSPDSLMANCVNMNMSKTYCYLKECL